MATISPTIAQAQGPNSDPRHGCFLVTWVLGNGDVGAAFSGPNFNVKSVHAFGTFASASLALQGSNEQTPTDWETLHDQSDNALTLSAAGLSSVQEAVTNIRPGPVTGGDGTTSITVVLLCVATSK